MELTSTELNGTELNGMENWIPVTDACERAGISHRRMLRLLESGVLKGEQAGDEWTVAEESVEEWMAAHRVEDRDLDGINLERPDRATTEMLEQVLALRWWTVRDARDEAARDCRCSA